MAALTLQNMQTSVNAWMRIYDEDLTPEQIMSMFDIISVSTTGQHINQIAEPQRSQMLSSMEGFMDLLVSVRTPEGRRAFFQSMVDTLKQSYPGSPDPSYPPSTGPLIRPLSPGGQQALTQIETTATVWLVLLIIGALSFVGIIAWAIVRSKQARRPA